MTKILLVIVLVIVAFFAEYHWAVSQHREIASFPSESPVQEEQPESWAAEGPPENPPDIAVPDEGFGITPPRKAEPPPLPAPLELRQRGLLIPLSGLQKQDLRDSFEEARGGSRHEAIDLMAARGTPVVAAGDGMIRRLFLSKPGGLTIYQFDSREVYCYYYAHLDSYAPGLKEGNSVRQGQVIGYVGSTGNADPAAPHLHFAIFRLGPEKNWWQGVPVNPYPVLAGQSELSR